MEYVNALGLPPDQKLWREGPDETLEMRFTTQGWNGEHWLDYFRENKRHISRHLAKALASPEFLTSSSNLCYEVTIFKAKNFHNKSGSGVERILLEQGFTKPTPEVACMVHALLPTGTLTSMGLEGLDFPLNAQTVYGEKFSIVRTHITLNLARQTSTYFPETHGIVYISSQKEDLTRFWQNL